MAKRHALGIDFGGTKLLAAVVDLKTGEVVATAKKRTSATDGPDEVLERIHSVAQGRVWTGKQAREQGLVDELGGLDRALVLAKERAKIPADSEVEVVVYPRPKSFYELISEGVSSGSDAALRSWVASNLSADERNVLRALRGPATMFRRGEPLALMPTLYLE